MDILQSYIQECVEQQTIEVEKTIINFLRKSGYEIDDKPSPHEVNELLKLLEAQNKRLRVEIFQRFSGKCSITTAIFPFFEPIDQEISRVEIYRMLNLAEQGYQI